MVISMSEFTKLSEKEQHNTLNDLKQTIGVNGIVEAWGISRSKVYSMLLEYNIPTNGKGTSKTEGKKTANSRKESRNEPGSTEHTKKTMVSNKASSPTGNRKTRKTRRPRSSNPVLHSGPEEDSKFTLHMDTQGTATVISEALQLILESNQFSHSNLHVNLMVEEI